MVTKELFYTDQPFFSIIIPTYNSEKAIYFCLQSILRQSFSNFEVLIVDGLSSDTTLEIVRNFNDERIKIHCEKDKGIYDAMNKGIKLAKGKWLYFLGSDDIIYNSKVFETVYDTLRNKRSKIVYGNILVKGNTDWAIDQQVYDGSFDFEKILQKNVCHQAIFYHFKVLRRVGMYNTRYPVCADYDLNLKCFSKYKFTYLDNIISIFAGGGLSSSIIDQNFIQEKDFKILKYFNIKLILDKKYQCFHEKVKALRNRAYPKLSLKDRLFITTFYYLFEIKLLFK